MAVVVRKRVMLVSPLPPPMGGMANQARILADCLESEGVVVVRVRSNQWRNIPPLRDFATWRSFWSAAKDVDVVNIHTCCYLSYFGTAVPIIWLSKRLGKRLVVTYKGGNAREVFSLTGNAGLRWLRMADQITVPSGFLQDVFSNYGVKTTIVQNLIEPEVRVMRPRRIDTDAPRLIMTRGLEHYYDVGSAIRAFRIFQERYPRACLLIAGRGNEERKLRALVRRLGLGNVSFLGELSRVEIHDLYRSGDISLNSSKVDNFPGALLESFLFGVPIVTTDAGGIPYMVKHGVSARVVPVGDHPALAREITFLVENPHVAERMAAQAQESIRLYEWQSARSRWMEVLDV